MHPHSPARLTPCIEPLEARIAPANALVFVDSDGDIITVFSSQGVIPPNVVTANPGPGVLGLQEINIIDPAMQGGSLSVTVKAAPGGDGLVEVGAINANGFVAPVSGSGVVAVDLASVTVQGDLGRIQVGTGAFGVTALGSLTVNSMGVDAGGGTGGTGAQIPGDNTGSLIAGNLGKLTVKGDIFGAALFIAGNLGSVTIGGSLIGSNFPNSGSIFTASTFPTGGATAPGNIGPVKIGGSIIGGAHHFSGVIFAPGGNLTSLTVGGDVTGGTGDLAGGVGGFSGSVFVGGPLGIGAVKIGGSILGNPAAVNPINNGGTYTPFVDSGSIRATGPIASLTVGGSIIGGAGFFGGFVQAGGAMGKVKVGGDIRGDDSALDFYTGVNLLGLNGGIQSFTSMGSVTVGGSLIGGTGHFSGVIFVGTETFNATLFVPILIGGAAITPGVNGLNLPGGVDPSGLPLPLSLPFFGPLGSGAMGAVKIGGSVIGGTLPYTGAVAQGATGWIKSEGPMGKVTVGRDVVGGTGQYSGSIQSHTSIASVSIGGDVVGGSGFDSGSVFAGTVEVFNGPALPLSLGVGPVKIGGSLIGGAGNLSGTLYDDTLIASVTIGGNLVGSQGSTSGLLSAPGGAIVSSGALGPIVIKGSLIGGNVPGTGNINAFGGNIASVTIGRDLNGSNVPIRVPTTGIYASGILGPVKVGGSIMGSGTGGGEVFLLADGGITSLTVKGRVQYADIMAGSTYYATNFGFVLTASNADAFIGPVKVGGDWVASSLVAGVTSNGAGGFSFATQGSTLTDEAGAFGNNGIASRIASITIGGRLVGNTANGLDAFVFTAETIGSLSINKKKQPLATLAPTPGPIALASSSTGDALIWVLGGN